MSSYGRISVDRWTQGLDLGKTARRRNGRLTGLGRENDQIDRFGT